MTRMPTTFAAAMPTASARGRGELLERLLAQARLRRAIRRTSCPLEASLARAAQRLEAAPAPARRREPVLTAL